MVRTRILIDSDTDRFARKQRWTDALLVRVVEDLENGLHDGALGSNVYKRRIAREGSGSSSGYRVVVVLRVGDRAFIVEAFAKNVKLVHTPQEAKALRTLANLLLNLAEEDLSRSIEAGDFREIER